MREFVSHRIAIILVALASGGAFTGCAAPADDRADEAVNVGVADEGLQPSSDEVRMPSTVTNNTYRATSEITPIVLDAMRSELANYPEIDVDEGRDRTTTAGALRLAAAVTSLVYANGNVSATVRLTVYGYWSGALLGNITKTITVVGVTPYNVPAENLAISTATTQATRTFAQTIGSY